MSSHSAHIKLLALVGTLLLGVATNASAASNVRRITGTVLVWTPWAFTWRSVVPGENLPDGSLVQVSSLSSLTLRMGADAASPGSLPVELVVSRPIVFRSGRDTVRQIRNVRMGVEQSAHAELSSDDEAGDFSLENAWNRATASLNASTLAKLIGVVKNKGNGRGVEMRGGGNRTIRMLSPSDKEKSPIDRSGTSNVRVAWEKDSNVNQSYRIYMWKKDASERTLQAETSDDSATVKVGRPGEYWVQVETKDGKTSSDVHRIVITASSSGSAAPHALDPEARVLRLLKPGNDFTVTASPDDLGNASIIDFAWRPLPQARYKIEIEDATGATKTIAVRPDETSVALPVAPGRSRWRVLAMFPDNSNISSEWRLLDLGRAPTDQDLTQALNSQKRRISLYLGQ